MPLRLHDLMAYTDRVPAEDVPPDEERMYTVGREAILEDDLEGLDVAGDAVEFVDLTK